MLLFVSLMIVIFSCAKKNEIKGSIPPELRNNWVIREIDNLSGIQYDPLNVEYPVLRLGGPKVSSGTTTVGCNTIAFDVESGAGKQVSFTKIVKTEMACADYAQSETTIINALGRVRAYQVDGGTLSLLDANDKVIMKCSVIGQL